MSENMSKGTLRLISSDPQLKKMPMPDSQGHPYTSFCLIKYELDNNV